MAGTEMKEKMEEKMGVTWTEEQRKVIDTRNRNILVSAAAGSGKTAVLVARIMALVTDPEHPVDIDRLLIVTFTNAAASEMRQRIRDALEKHAEEEPENVHLQRQLVLIHNAKITTIHSFCLQVLRSHFHTIGIDPSFRIADEGEMQLLKQEVLKELLDEAYAEGSEEFHAFLEQFAPGKNDHAVEEAVLALYHFSLGQPWPGEWMEQCRAAYAPDLSEKCEQDEEETEKTEKTEKTVKIQKEDLTEVYEAEGYEAEHQVSNMESVNSNWLNYAVEDTRAVLFDVLEQIQTALRIAQEPGGPYPYVKALQDDAGMVEALLRAEDYEALAQAFAASGTHTRLSTKKDPEISEEKKLRVQEIRAQVKADIADVRVRYFYDRPEILREEFYESGVIVRVLTTLAERFSELLSEKKTEKNLLDFSDLEHLALKVLTERKDGQTVPSAAAREYADQLEEIMVDEYQDSNLVQEILLNSIAGRGRGVHNRFMVGDVKQSIYRFRLARPELFLEKYRTYQADGEQDCRIDLHRNFRSRKEVLNSINYIFCQIMTENPGGIVYDEDAALYAGAEFAPLRDAEIASAQEFGERQEENGEELKEADKKLQEKQDQSFGDNADSDERKNECDEHLYQTELVLLESDGQGKREAEARLIGQRIREIVGHLPVWDKMLRDPETGEAAGGYRPAEYRDIVILQRAVTGWADTFGEVLSDMGIPCFTGSQSGYFSAPEVRVVLSYLAVLDNPVQDIPLAAVLRSPIGGLKDEELARIRGEVSSEKLLSHDYAEPVRDHEEMAESEAEEAEEAEEEHIWMQEEGGSRSEEESSGQGGRTNIRMFFDCCMWYRENGQNPELKEKLNRFFETLNQFREKAAYTPVHLLLWEILDVTGYGEYASALPAGRQRKANLDMLVEKAIAYEATSYRGLYHFVRYIENLKRYEVDYGEANIGTESDNTVRIMSIHKSKGLEFPVVFLCGMGKRFNESDTRSKIVMHPELGIGCDFVDTRLRQRRANLLKKIIQKTGAMENLAEELRILYVAMTRAKEKLILTGTVADAQAKLAEWSSAAHTGELTLPYSRRTQAATYLDWVMMALLRHPSSETLAGEAGVEWSAWKETVSGLLCERRNRSEAEKEPGFQNAEAEQPEAFLAEYSMKLVREGDLEETERAVQRNELFRLEELVSMPSETEQDQELRAYLKSVFLAEYPYAADQNITAKFTVSELKKLSYDPTEEGSEPLYPADETEEYEPTGRAGGYEAACKDDVNEEYEAMDKAVRAREYEPTGSADGAGSDQPADRMVDPDMPRPAFRTAAEEIRGAARGTLYHTFMENFDFHKKEEPELQLEELISCGKMTRDEAAVICRKDIRTFLNSEIGRRMEQAALAGRLFREQPFVLGVPANTIRPEWNEREQVLIQGIIDAWFVEEDGKIVLVDYKTDRVKQISELADRYRLQLDYYASALSRLTGREVKEKVIYSFYLGASLKILRTEK